MYYELCGENMQLLRRRKSGLFVGHTEAITTGSLAGITLAAT